MNCSLGEPNRRFQNVRTEYTTPALHFLGFERLSLCREVKRACLHQKSE